MFALISIHFLLHRAKSHVSHFFNFLPDRKNLLFGHKFLQIPKRQLICILELTIVRRIFLDSIISKMYKVIVNIFGWESLGWSTQVGLFKKIDGHRFCEQCPNSNIELPIMDKEGFFHILLNYKWTSVKFKFLHCELSLRNWSYSTLVLCNIFC